MRSLLTRLVGSDRIGRKSLVLPYLNTRLVGDLAHAHINDMIIYEKHVAPACGGFFKGRSRM